MTVRRQRGATLGLAAACVLVVIVIGVGFFFLSKIIGGGRQVANATDAGALNVAKQAIRRGAVTLSSAADQEEFGALCDTPNRLDLLSYNRIVAKAMIVCKNAQDEGTPLAAANAGMIHNQVNMLGNMLKANLVAACANPGGALAGDFHAISTNNNTKMFNGNPVQLAQDITPGYMKVGSSSNVFFHGATKASMGGWAPPVNSAGQKAPSGDDYSAGYQQVAAGAQNFTLVPVFPDTRPHLVDHGNFSAAVPAGVTTPAIPNAFQTNSRALEGKTGMFGGSIACAIVGCLDKQYAARLPKGFVRIVNGPSALTVNTPHFPLSTVVNDGSNDIFNQELFHAPGINMDQNTNIFSHSPAGPQAMADIGAYNQTKGNFPFDPLVGNVGGGDPALWTGKAEDPYNNPAAYDLRTTAANNHYASQADLDMLGSTNVMNCIYTMYDIDPATNPHCSDANTLMWMGNYGRSAVNGSSVIDPVAGFSNVEFMKGDMLAQRAHGYRSAHTSAPAPSGVKLWGRNGSGTVLRPPANGSAKPYLGGKINYLANGSPMELLNEIGGCASTSTVDKIIDRMRQVNPEDGNLAQHVRDALASATLPLGKTFYMYADGSQVYMTETFPVGGGYLSEIKAGGLTPDGQGAATASNCNTGNYPLSGWVVNTRKGVGGAPIGDAGYHEVPFTHYNNTSVANDAAHWAPSSGYNNFLGELKFEQTATGDSYSKPN